MQMLQVFFKNTIKLGINFKLQYQQCNYCNNNMTDVNTTALI